MTRNPFLLTLLFGSLLAGCSHNPPVNPQDPYETLNRQVFRINNCFDKTILKPTAVIYNNIIPPPIQRGVNNVFDNLLEPQAFVNDLLQGKINYALIDVTRMLINTTIGIVGFFDVAKHVGLPYHTNDFGKTFAYWSANKKSAYLVLPFIGPSTIRDTIGLTFSGAVNPLFYFQSNVTTYVPFAVYYVNLRAQLLTIDKMIKQSFDPYAAVRDAYLQHRNGTVMTNAKQPDYPRHQILNTENTINDEPVSELTSDTPIPDDFTFD